MNTSSNSWLEDLQSKSRQAGFLLHALDVIVNYDRIYTEEEYSRGIRFIQGAYNLESGTVNETIILINFNHGSHSLKYRQMVDWGLQHGLRKSIPHVLFSIDEQFPELFTTLKNFPKFREHDLVYETTGCDIQWGYYAGGLCLQSPNPNSKGKNDFVLLEQHVFVEQSRWVNHWLVFRK